MRVATVKRTLTIAFSAVFALMTALAFAQAAKFTQLAAKQPTSSPEGKVELAEVFMYGCPGCFGLEPHFAAWIEKKPDYVNVVRVPAPWNPAATLHARAYYTAEILGKLDEMHADFFTEIHEKRNMLDTEDKLAEFFGRYGVADKSFRDTFKSFAVETKVRRAAELIKLYEISATPGLIINGRHKPNLAAVDDYPQLFDNITEKVAELNAAN
jgi:thiol:disulfide interchange protein DsbA